MLLLRQMMAIGCQPGSVGAMATGASPLDPIFWVLHPAFEKALHILELSPSYRDTYDMTWVDSPCNNKIGGSLTDPLPFTGLLYFVMRASYRSTFGYRRGTYYELLYADVIH